MKYHKKNQSRQVNPALVACAAKPKYRIKESPLISLRRHAKRLAEYLWYLSRSVRIHRVDAVLVHGTEKHSKAEMKVLYFGKFDKQGRAIMSTSAERTEKYNNHMAWMNRIFSDYRVVETHRNLPSISIKKWIRIYENDVDLIIIDTELLYNKIYVSEKTLSVPQWIMLKFRIDDKWDDVLGKFHSNGKKDLKRILKKGYTFRISKSDEDLRNYYHNIYLPYVKKRFGKIAFYDSEKKFLRDSRKRELMLISHENQIVLGAILHNSVGRLAGMSFGITEEAGEEISKGITSVRDFFIIRYGYEMGYDEVDFMGCRAVLNDGPLRHKRKWGSYVTNRPYPVADALLLPLNFSPCTRSLFVNNPFVVRQNGVLVGKVVLEGETVTRKELTSCYKMYHMPGLDRLVIFSLSGFENDLVSWAATNMDGVTLYDISNSKYPEREITRLS